jgi:hypothetical protein
MLSENPQVQMQSMSILRDSNGKIYSTTATFTSAGDAGTDDDDEGDISGEVVNLVSFVATPRPRHKGHAFRPEPNHWTMLNKIREGYYLIYTFFME